MFYNIYKVGFLDKFEVKEGKIQTPSWDLFIGLFFIIGFAYGYILQRERVTVTLLSVYVALVVTSVMSPLLEKFFIGDSTIGSFFIKANLSPFTLKTGVFCAVIMLLSTRAGVVGLRSRSFLSSFEVGAYAFLNSALILSTIILFAPAETRDHLVASSKLASRLMQYATWWVILPAVVMIVSGFQRNRNHDDD